MSTVVEYGPLFAPSYARTRYRYVFFATVESVNVVASGPVVPIWLNEPKLLPDFTARSILLPSSPEELSTQSNRTALEEICVATRLVGAFNTTAFTVSETGRVVLPLPFDVLVNETVSE